MSSSGNHEILAAKLRYVNLDFRTSVSDGSKLNEHPGLTNLAFVLGAGRSGVMDWNHDQGGPWAKTIARLFGDEKQYA
jgi:hypothetical protein